MGNIIITKTDTDLDFDVAYFGIEIRNKVQPSTSTFGFVGSINMYIYEGRIKLQEIATDIIKFSLNPVEKYCLKFEDTVLGTDGILLLEFSAHSTGHVKIKVNAKTGLNTENVEECTFNFQSELGLIEKFGKNLKTFSEQGALQEVSLHE